MNQSVNSGQNVLIYALICDPLLPWSPSRRRFWRLAPEHDLLSADTVHSVVVLLLLLLLVSACPCEAHEGGSRFQSSSVCIDCWMKPFAAVAQRYVTRCGFQGNSP